MQTMRSKLIKSIIELIKQAQQECPVLQTVSITSCSVPGHHWEESGSLFCIPSHQMFIHTDKISPEPSFCQAKQSQLAQPQFIGKMLQALSHHCGPSPDSFQHVHVSLDWGAQL